MKRSSDWLLVVAVVPAWKLTVPLSRLSSLPARTRRALVAEAERVSVAWTRMMLPSVRTSESAFMMTLSTLMWIPLRSPSPRPVKSILPLGASMVTLALAASPVDSRRTPSAAPLMFRGPAEEAVKPRPLRKVIPSVEETRFIEFPVDLATKSRSAWKSRGPAMLKVMPALVELNEMPVLPMMESWAGASKSMVPAALLALSERLSAAAKEAVSWERIWAFPVPEKARSSPASKMMWPPSDWARMPPGVEEMERSPVLEEASMWSPDLKLIFPRLASRIRSPRVVTMFTFWALVSRLSPELMFTSLADDWKLIESVPRAEKKLPVAEIPGASMLSSLWAPKERMSEVASVTVALSPLRRSMVMVSSEEE
mmetsp:Transcript_43005/g.71577  ORF Transcript_43005/g.71577 Transcript_43005/m.71577 type:complete len:369 (-) Transcript_43005:229-1335(-)